MDRDRLIFCPDLATGLTTRLNTQVMAEELAEKVFGDRGFAKLLKARYDQMGKLFRDAHYNDPRWDLPGYDGCENCATPNKRDARLKVPKNKIHCNGNNANVTRLFDYDNFGHDMPVWLSYNDDPNARRVMIISQDPKRDNDQRGNIYLSTPFGLHSRDWRRGNAQVRQIAHMLMDSGYCVYFTDSMKFYAGDGSVVRQSIDNNDQDGYKGIFSVALNVEIERVNPAVIIKLGDEALNSDYIDSVFANSHNAFDGFDLQEINGRQVIAAYHPNGTKGAIGRIRKLVNNAERPVKTYYQSIAQTAINYLGLIA